MSSGFSFDSAVELYEKATVLDSILQQKHLERLWIEIREAIRRKQAYCDYIVPATMGGAVQPYNRAEVMLFLVEYCRKEKFTVEVLDVRAGEIRVSGWQEKLAKTQADQDVIKIFTEKKPNKASSDLNAHLQNLVNRYQKK